MQVPEIIHRLELLLDTSREDSIYKLGKARAYASAYLYELELLRKSELAVITGVYSKDMAYNKAEGMARASDEYRNFLGKLAKAKLKDELAVNDHKQASNLQSFYEKRLSLAQTEMRLR